MEYIYIYRHYKYTACTAQDGDFGLFNNARLPFSHKYVCARVRVSYILLLSMSFLNRVSTPQAEKIYYIKRYCTRVGVYNTNGHRRLDDG